MAYRDDREALEAQLAELRAALEEARRAESELGQAAAQRAALERKLADVEARLQRAAAAQEAKRARPGRRWRWALPVGALPLLLLAGWRLAGAGSSAGTPPPVPSQAPFDMTGCMGRHEQGDAPPPTLDGPIIDYTVSGGIGGQAAHLRVLADGRLAIESFGKLTGEPRFRDYPPLDRLFELSRSRRGFFEISEDGSCMADGMSTSITFHGSGTEPLTASERQELSGLAAGLVPVATGLAPLHLSSGAGAAVGPQVPAGGFLPWTPPARPSGLLFRLDQQTNERPLPRGYNQACWKIDVHEDGLLRCEQTCAHTTGSMRVRGSSAFDRLKEIVSRSRPAGARAVMGAETARQEIDLSSFGHGGQALQDTDWHELYSLATSLAYAGCPGP